MCFPLTECLVVSQISQIPEPSCGICDLTIAPDVESYELDCGCTYHLCCLMDDLEVLVECPQCKEEIIKSDALVLMILHQLQA
ncbi:hypothetical protein AVEN_167044-1 [Araneus ventricosus]|uniref:RING-type domain-containing protein n=1 Tax=Araneus ventricosus TaxID=182803 RepID=A0A4Y2SIU3_ARAVE|nr:hypothetical protein AVEN_167044-1 [Araneus ventricosus]